MSTLVIRRSGLPIDGPRARCSPVSFSGEIPSDASPSLLADPLPRPAALPTRAHALRDRHLLHPHRRRARHGPHADRRATSARARDSRYQPAFARGIRGADAQRSPLFGQRVARFPARSLERPSNRLAPIMTGICHRRQTPRDKPDGRRGAPRPRTVRPALRFECFATNCDKLCRQGHRLGYHDGSDRPSCPWNRSGLRFLVGWRER